MFKVNIGNNRVVAFTFKHQHLPNAVKLYGSSAWVKSQTRCTLELDGIPFYAWSYCSVNDIFNKDKARKVSLAKAMGQAGLSKDEREMVWERYHWRWLSNPEFEYAVEDVCWDMGDKPMQDGAYSAKEGKSVDRECAYPPNNYNPDNINGIGFD